MHRVLIADDHPPTLADVEAAVRADARFDVVAAVGDAPAAVRGAVALDPDACLLDVRMPGCGIAAAWEITARLPGVRVVMLSATAEEGQLLPALRAGACGYLLKDTPSAELPRGLWDVLHGRAAMPGELVARVLDDVRDRSSRRRTPAVAGPGGVPLTGREWQVLELLREGRSTREIARTLTLTPATVRSHVAAVVRKAGVTDRTALLPGC